MEAELKPTKADKQIELCLTDNLSFYVVAGAGSGKTTSLISALQHIQFAHGKRLRRNGQRVVCVTYTKRAVAVISERLAWDELFCVSTLHSFLWGEIKRFHGEIRAALHDELLPTYIAKHREEDDGKATKKATEARAKADKLEQERDQLKSIDVFEYGDSPFSDFAKGELGHDDMIAVAAILIRGNERLQRIIGQKYPYIFVDEAQDTHDVVVEAFNTLCGKPGLPLVGYFGDPLQQIYDKRAGDFKGPEGSLRIPKEENFRSTKSVIALLNAFRTDLQQVAAGPNGMHEGSVRIRLLLSEEGKGERKRQTPEQLDASSLLLDKTLAEWGWTEGNDIKFLFLVRQMIARRQKFAELNELFNGDFASQRAHDEFEKGEHFLIRPFVSTLYPLICAYRADDRRRQIDILRTNAPAFDPKGENAKVSLANMLKRANANLKTLDDLCTNKTTKEVFKFCEDNRLCDVPQRLSDHLNRPPRAETYNDELNSAEKGDWLADAFFAIGLPQIERYCEFVTENTVFSTQHGVKGEQYDRVLVVFDDAGSAWNNYSFSRTLTPKTAGKEPTEGQLRLTTRMAYVCFSRARHDLRIVMYTSSPAAARTELIEKGLFKPEQIEI